MSTPLLLVMTFDQRIIDFAAGDLVETAQMLLGPLPGWRISTTAVGHSRRPDSFAVRIAQEVARRTGRRFAKVFRDRFVSGVSHPKEFRNLPQLRLRTQVRSPILLIDDVATSGWHMEEALTMLRRQGVPAIGLVWICGIIK